MVIDTKLPEEPFLRAVLKGAYLLWADFHLTANPNP